MYNNFFIEKGQEMGMQKEQNLTFRLAQVGTFDLENYGDLLFPVVLENELRQRIESVEIDLFSPYGGNMPFGDKDVYPIQELENRVCSAHYDAIVVGGGDIVRIDNQLNADRDKYNMDIGAWQLWLIPVMVAIKHDIPVLLNAPGVPFSLAMIDRELLKAIILSISYLSVRDSTSAQLLFEATDIMPKVVPDSVFAIGRCFPKNVLDERFITLSEKLKLPERYVVFQINNLEEGIGNQEYHAMLSGLEKDMGAQVVFMPIGYVHEDRECMMKLNHSFDEPFMFIEEKLSPPDMLAVISHAQGFVGTSMHGSVTAQVYGVPTIGINNHQITKMAGVYGVMKLSRSIVGSIREVEAKRFGHMSKYVREENAKILDKHFDDMSGIITGEIKKDIRKLDLGKIAYTALVARQSELIVSKLYFDYGNGFSEADSKVIDSLAEDEMDFSVLETIDDNVKIIRFDPVESGACAVKLMHVDMNGVAIQEWTHNGHAIGDFIYFNTDDPMICFQLPNGKDRKLSLRALLYFPSDVLFNIVANEIMKLEQANIFLQEKDDVSIPMSVFFQEKGCYSDKNVVVIENTGKCDTRITLSEDIKIPSGCRKVRIDPEEGYPCIVEDVKLAYFGKRVNAAPINGFQLDDFFFFPTEDPQFEVELPNADGLTLHINMTLRLYDVRDMMLDAVRRKIEADREVADAMEQTHTDEIDTLKEELGEKDKYIGEVVTLCNDRLDQIEKLTATVEALQSANRQLDDRCNVAEQNYAVISKAFFWKITKPARAIVDGTKRLIGKNQRLYNTLRSAKWTLRHGPKEARRRKNELGAAGAGTPLIDAGHSAEKTPLQTAIIHSNAGVINGEICFSVIVPLFNTESLFLREMIESVLGQTYANWQLCLADASDDAHSYVGDICREYAARDNRVNYYRLERNLMISGNTNAAEAQAKGEFIALLDHDDLLVSNALEWNANEIARTGCDVLYSDEDHLLLNGKHGSVLHKPDWSPHLLNSQMYICHLLVIRKALFDQIGGFRSAFDGSQDYDLILRLSEQTTKIKHIPEILYTWRESLTSTAINADSKPYTQLAGLHALNDHLKRVYGPDAHADESEYLFVYDARYPLPVDTMVSIIIPMKDKWELTEACIKSIEDKSTWKNYEIIILDNRSKEKGTYKWLKSVRKNNPRVQVVKADMEFNWSKLNNFGMQHAKGDVYIFLNNDTLVISPDWMERLSEKALLNEVGAVGPLLLYEDDTIQHAGVVVGFGGWADHVFKGMKPVHYGSPFISPMVTRNVLAVTGACMAVSQKTIEKIGGFDETFIICGSDVELCIRAHERGLFNIYDAGTRLYHLESKSRDSYIPDNDFKRSYECYTPYREGVDPYYNKNLDRNSVIPRILN